MRMLSWSPGAVCVAQQHQRQAGSGELGRVAEPAERGSYWVLNWVIARSSQNGSSLMSALAFSAMLSPMRWLCRWPN
ncbi:MAG: hypothetical protein CM1200mP29_00610 [Verrucomicrobiota bacterium]|nr:MAG: hypothetical protein CM1200mP29_00610 [Verrucomicrobiota bacterium]